MSESGHNRFISWLNRGNQSRFGFAQQGLFFNIINGQRVYLVLKIFPNGRRCLRSIERRAGNDILRGGNHLVVGPFRWIHAGFFPQCHLLYNLIEIFIYLIQTGNVGFSVRHITDAMNIDQKTWYAGVRRTELMNNISMVSEFIVSEFTFYARTVKA